MTKWLGRICVSVAVGFVAANSFTDAAGLADTDGGGDVVPFAGVIVGFLTLTALVFGEVQLRNLIDVLARAKQRPVTAMVIAIICSGSACLIGAVVLQLLGRGDASVSATGGAASASVNAHPSIMVPITTLALLIIGTTVIGIGIWGSIPPKSQNSVSEQSPPKEVEPPY